MRLIDADAFAKTLRDISKRQKYEELLTKKDGFPTVADVIEAICQDLDGTAIYGFKNAPTVEQPTGKWKEHDFKTFGGLGDWDYKCSNCEKVYCGKSNYCPNCGAKMKGVEE